METRGCFQLMPRESEPLGDAALSPRRNTTAPLKTGEIEAGVGGGKEKPGSRCPFSPRSDSKQQLECESPL